MPATSTRAAVVTRYGTPDVVELQDRPCPSPGPGMLRIRVVAAPVSSGDARIRALRMPGDLRTLPRLILGWSRPRRPVLGAELSGVVDAVGPGVTTLRVGDRVVAYPGMSLGAHAEHVLMRANGCVAPLPEGVSFEVGAALGFGGLTAQHVLRRAGVLDGRARRVLVVGASGAVGSAAVQLAVAKGAEVVGLASAASAPVVQALGARAVDYGTDAISAERPFDAIVDTVGTWDYPRARPLLAPGGVLARVVSDLSGQLAAPFQGRAQKHRVFSSITPERPDDYRALVAQVASGAFRPLIGQVLPLNRIREAHALVDTGHKRGSVVLRVSADA